jgi:cysteine rich repeat protein
MNAKICTALILIQISCSMAFAANDKQPASPPTGGLFNLQGTPEEQAACSPDASRFCSDAIPDTFRVLACLQENRQKLRKACLKVLENHGQ